MHLNHYSELKFEATLHAKVRSNIQTEHIYPNGYREHRLYYIYSKPFFGEGTDNYMKTMCHNTNKLNEGRFKYKKEISKRHVFQEQGKENAFRSLLSSPVFQ